MFIETVTDVFLQWSISFAREICNGAASTHSWPQICGNALCIEISLVELLERNAAATLPGGQVDEEVATAIGLPDGRLMLAGGKCTDAALRRQ